MVLTIDFPLLFNIDQKSQKNPGDCQILENIGTILNNIGFSILKNIDKYRKILKMKMPISQKLFLIQKI